MSSVIPAQAASPVAISLSSKGAYFPALDGLRALAFLLVFEQHYIRSPFTWAGVDIFFVLSGFLITGILYDSQNQEHRFRNFYIRRTLRIFPLYYGLFALLLLIHPYFHWELNWKWIIWPAYVGNYSLPLSEIGTQLQRLADAQLVSQRFSDWLVLYMGHFWSLCVEEQFYLVWPFVVYTIRDRKKLCWICITVVVLSPLVRVIAEHRLPPAYIDTDALYRWTPFHLEALMLGGLMALLLRGGQLPLMIRSSKIIALVVGPITAASIYLTVTNHFSYGWRHVYGLSLFALLSGALITYTLIPGSLAYNAFNWKPLRWFGGITYGAYVFHDIPHTAYQQWVAELYLRHNHLSSFITQEYATALLALLCTTLLAYLSYRFFESPFIALKDRFTKRSIRSQISSTSALGS